MSQPARARQPRDPIGAAVEALLAVTPEPPAADVDAADILARAVPMLEARAPICELLGALPESLRKLPATHHAQLALLLDRDARWSARLAAARRHLADQLTSASRLRNASR